MEMEIVRAFQAIDPKATINDLFEACRQLSVQSDRYHVLGSCEPSDIDTVATVIYQYILNPRASDSSGDNLSVGRPGIGEAIDCYSFAEMFSEDMMGQAAYRALDSLDVDAHRLAVKAFLAGILYRYQFCVDGDLHVFPVSMIIRYMDRVRALLLREQRADEWPQVLSVTLSALASLESHDETSSPLNSSTGC